MGSKAGFVHIFLTGSNEKENNKADVALKTFLFIDAGQEMFNKKKPP